MQAKAYTKNRKASILSPCALWSSLNGVTFVSLNVAPDVLQVLGRRWSRGKREDAVKSRPRVKGVPSTPDDLQRHQVSRDHPYSVHQL